MPLMALTGKLDLFLALAKPLQLGFGMCAVAMRAAHPFLKQRRGFVLQGERQAAGAAQFVLAGLQAMPDRYAFIENEALAVPQACVGGYGFQILEDAPLQMEYVVEAL
jgi:hypothetical protein